MTFSYLRSLLKGMDGSRWLSTDDGRSVLKSDQCFRILG
jgi:hypothetical protein